MTGGEVLAFLNLFFFVGMALGYWVGEEGPLPAFSKWMVLGLGLLVSFVLQFL